MIETPSAAFLQSSRERRSPFTSSTFLPALNRLSAFSRRSSRLENRMKQRRLAKPYSRSFSTTLEPIKPLDPVTKIRSSVDAIYSEFIAELSGKTGLGTARAEKPSHKYPRPCLKEPHTYRSSHLNPLSARPGRDPGEDAKRQVRVASSCRYSCFNCKSIQQIVPIGNS